MYVFVSTVHMKLFGKISRQGGVFTSNTEYAFPTQKGKSERKHKLNGTGVFG